MKVVLQKLQILKINFFYLTNSLFFPTFAAYQPKAQITSQSIKKQPLYLWFARKLTVSCAPQRFFIKLFKTSKGHALCEP
jgi:hypothetical protein